MEIYYNFACFVVELSMVCRVDCSASELKPNSTYDKARKIKIYYLNNILYQASL